MKRKAPHYPFLYSWNTSEAHVKRKAKIEAKSELAQISVKKDIVRSLILISFILILELVIYLALRLS